MIVAWSVLLIWPFLAIVFFVTMPIPAALVSTVVGGYLVLPEDVGFDLPVLPTLDKTSIPALSAILILGLIAKKDGPTPLKGLIPRNPVVMGLLGLMFAGVVGTVLTNGDSLLFQNRVLPGLRTWDMLSSILTMLMMLLPFFLGRKYLASEEAQLIALKTFVVIALGYSLLALFEVRMSPQLNVWVYGFFPHSFAQHIRGDGFRPLVFLNHGLWLAIFFVSSLMAAAGLVRSSISQQQKAFYMIGALWLLGTLILSKSLGALLIAIVFLGLIFMPKKLVRIGLACVIGMVIFYPVLRSLDFVPVDLLTSLAKRINAARAASLEFRLLNEKFILEHGWERPAFGWGGWDRNRAIEMENGRRVVPDGRWTISFGQGGYVRFFSEFGLLCAGVLGLAFSRRSVSFIPLTIALLLTANLLDLLPNATLTAVTWLWAGALAGRLEIRESESSERTEASLQNIPGKRRETPNSGYARTQSSQAPYRRDLNEMGRYK